LDPDHTAGLEELGYVPDPDINESIRQQLRAILAEARALTGRLPGGGSLAAAMDVEWSFRNRCGWLPRQEAYDLRCAFIAEMERLYDAVDEWPPYAAFPPVPPEPD
jgi:hypothetical protein